MYTASKAQVSDSSHFVAPRFGSGMSRWPGSRLHSRIFDTDCSVAGDSPLVYLGMDCTVSGNTPIMISTTDSTATGTSPVVTLDAQQATSCQPSASIDTVLDTALSTDTDSVLDMDSVETETTPRDGRGAAPNYGYLAPGTARWTLRCLREDKPEGAIAALRIWTHPQRRDEATYEAMNEIVNMEDELACQALLELATPMQFIRSSHTKEQTVIPTKLIVNATHEVNAMALLDSGCTGSCINTSFVQKHGIPTRCTARPIPVRNADGTLNSGGPIIEYVTLHLVIQDHEEDMDLAVSNLGHTDLFIGHEWLKRHNPHIDWKQGSIKFDRCPKSCSRSSPLLVNIDDNEEEEEERFTMEEGERLFAFDWEHYQEVYHVRTHAADIAIKEHAKKKEQMFTERVPTAYHEYKDIFDKDDFDKLPE